MNCLWSFPDLCAFSSPSFPYSFPILSPFFPNSFPIIPLSFPPLNLFCRAHSSVHRLTMKSWWSLAWNFYSCVMIAVSLKLFCVGCFFSLHRCKPFRFISDLRYTKKMGWRQQMVGWGEEEETLRKCHLNKWQMNMVEVDMEERVIRWLLNCWNPSENIIQRKSGLYICFK